MRLYFVQHAEAVSKDVDPERPLSESGLKAIQKVAVFIKPLELQVDYLWHSGKKRAAQTAEVLAEVIKINKSQGTHDGLGPTDDAIVIRDELTSTAADNMIVGHLPFLSNLASLLLTGSESTEIIAFKNAGIVCLSNSEENQWQAEWIVVPELLT